MSSANPSRTRSERIANAVIRPGLVARILEPLRHPETLARLVLCLLTASFVWVATASWYPPFAYRIGYVPPRDIVAQAKFEVPDDMATHDAREDARRSVICVYAHDQEPLTELQRGLKNQVFAVASAEEYMDSVWLAFLPLDEKGAPPDETRRKASFEAFRKALADDMKLDLFSKAVQQAFFEFQQHGLLAELHDLREGSQREIAVHPVGNPSFLQRFDADQVQVANAQGRLRLRLLEEFKRSYPSEDAAETLTEHVMAWLRKQLPQTTTLALDEEATNRARDEAAANVAAKTRLYDVGKQIVPGGKELDAGDLALLRAEFLAMRSQLTFGWVLQRALADFGMYIAFCSLCGYYIYRRERWLLRGNIGRFAAILMLVAVTATMSCLCALAEVPAEIGPLLLFGMIVAIAYQQELALLLSAVVCLLVVVSLGQGLPEFVAYTATVASSIFMLGHIRSRTKLLYVAAWSAAVCFFTALGINVLTGQPFGWSLLSYAGMLAGCALVTGLLMAAFLPFMERLFDVQTDIRLLELGDVAHPLLQELVRRAPGTYNHSINVASIGEAAADAIGANGLLVRVGAYFHDIGKMLKPGYFIENQGADPSRHESLVPAMSTLVIIAHVKDGADLARKHRLPTSLIDFIEQHHGTTLVEYFYRQAAKQSKSDPNQQEVDETNFRYPGPKPQTRETGVLMLSDAVESACRALVDPAPARIENLVHEISMKRLLDGQFDECGLTLQEIETIEDSLIKSLTAVYHGRVKYPDQQTA